MDLNNLQNVVVLALVLAVVLALILAVTAKTEKLSQECLEHAQEIAATLNPKEVELCKMAAEVALEIQKEGKHR